MPSDRCRMFRLEAPREFREQLIDDVREGLTARPRALPARYLYDARGSELFEKITQLDEYYQTRTETALLQDAAPRLIDAVRPVEILELGSGSSTKTRLLLEAMHAAGTGRRYLALDVSESALEEAGQALTSSYPWLTFDGFLGDFHAPLTDIPSDGRRLTIFLGSTIGNFEPDKRSELFRRLGHATRADDRVLIGTDLVKDRAVLEAAYDDAKGVTREFILNGLTVINRELDADFPVRDFEYRAPWVPEERRMEMWLFARRPLTVQVPGADLTVTFDEGDGLLLEVAYKFTRETFASELADSGLEIDEWITDPGNNYALALLAPAG